MGSDIVTTKTLEETPGEGTCHMCHIPPARKRPTQKHPKRIPEVHKEAGETEANPIPPVPADSDSIEKMAASLCSHLLCKTDFYLGGGTQRREERIQHKAPERRVHHKTHAAQGRLTPVTEGCVCRSSFPRSCRSKGLTTISDDCSPCCSHWNGCGSGGICLARVFRPHTDDPEAGYFLLAGVTLYIQDVCQHPGLYVSRHH